MKHQDSKTWLGLAFVTFLAGLLAGAFMEREKQREPTWVCVQSREPNQTHERVTRIEGERYVCRREY